MNRRSTTNKDLQPPSPSPSRSARSNRDFVSEEIEAVLSSDSAPSQSSPRTPKSSTKANTDTQNDPKQGKAHPRPKSNVLPADSTTNRRRSARLSTAKMSSHDQLESDDDLETQTPTFKPSPVPSLPRNSRSQADRLNNLKQIRVVSGEGDSDGDDSDVGETVSLLHSRTNKSPSSSPEGDSNGDSNIEGEDPSAYKLIQTRGEIELTTILGVGTSRTSPSSQTDNAESTPTEEAKSANATVPTSIWADLRGDFMNVFVLFMLYTLQGLPIGLSQTIPLVMTEKKVGFAAQAVFSLVTLPFSCKLLWAPLVDSYYSPALGKRKSWILPTQILCGLALLVFRSSIDFWITGNVDGQVVDGLNSTPQVDVFSLSTFFIFLYFLMATQDIAVDAWALTMLRSRNVVWAGTINNIGQYAGMYLTNVSYLLLSSPTFCSQYLWFLLPTRVNEITGLVEVVEQGLLDIKTLMTCCGLLFIITTVIIIVFKTEDDVHPYDQLADLFWQLQERKRVAGALTVPLSISLKPVKAQSRLPQSSTSPTSHESADLHLTRSRSNKPTDHFPASTSTSLSTSPPQCMFDQHHPDFFETNGKQPQNVSDLIPKKLYPHSLANIEDPTIMVDLSNQIYQRASNITNKSLYQFALTTTPSTNNSSFSSTSSTSPQAQPSATLAPLSSPFPILHQISTERRYLAHADDGDCDEGLLVTLSRMKNVLALSNVRLLVFWLLTFRISIAACDSITELKLISRGLHKEQLAYLQSLLAPITVMVPVYLTSVLSTSKTPFSISVFALVPRIILCFFWVSFVALFPYLLSHDYSSTIFALLFLLTFAQHFAALTQMVSGMSFFALVADPKIAGTFITMLHTAANLGAMSARLASMYLVDLFTVNICMQGGERADLSDANFITTVKGVDISTLYNKQLLHNLELLQFGGKPPQNDDEPIDAGQEQPNNSHTKQSPPDQPQSLFLQSLLAQPKPIQEQTIQKLFDSRITHGESVLFRLSHNFISRVRSFFESIHLISPNTSKIFFHEAYLAANSQLSDSQLIDFAPKVNIHDLPQFKSALQEYFELVGDSKGTIDPRYLKLVQGVDEVGTSDVFIKTEWSTLSPLLSHALTSHTALGDHSVATQGICEQIGGVKSSVVDGYFVEVIACGMFGLVYFTFMWPYLKKIDLLPISAWRSK